MASSFHSKPLAPVPSGILKEIEFPRDYNEAERAGICDLILKSDAFMTECFIKQG